MSFDAQACSVLGQWAGLDPIRLKGMLELYDPAPLHSDDLVIDTSTLSPSEAAETVATALT